MSVDWRCNVTFENERGVVEEILNARPPEPSMGIPGFVAVKRADKLYTHIPYEKVYRIDVYEGDPADEF